MFTRQSTFLICACLFVTFVTCIARAQDDVATAQDYLKFVRPYFPGSWNVETVDANDAVMAEGVIKFRMNRRQRCAVSIGTGKSAEMVSTAIHGYNPATKSWRVLQFAGDGSMLEMEVTIKKDVLTAGKYENVSYMHKNIVTNPDGTREVSTWKATIVDQDHFVLEQQSDDAEKRLKMRFVRAATGK